MSPSSCLPRRGLAALAAACLALVVLLNPASADAHPFGDPQTVEIEPDPEGADEVRVHWRVGGTDDLTLLAVALRLLPQDRVMLDGAVSFEESDPATLAGASAFRDYLLKRIAVQSAGTPCAGSVEPIEDLAADGVRLAFTCPAPVETARVTVRMLTDLHPAYQTLAAGPDGQRAVYDAHHPSHDWSLAGAAGAPAAAAAPADLGRSAATQLGVIGAVGGVLASLLTGLVWLRRRGRA